MPTIRSYLADTRDLGNSVLLVLPLFLLYQVGLLATGGVRNGVDFLTDVLWAAAGGTVAPYIALNVAIVGAVFGLILTLQRDHARPFHRGLWLPVLLESMAYATVMGSLIVFLLVQVPGVRPSLSTVDGSGLWTRLVLSIGAGVHEEIVFRLGLFGALAWGGRRAGWSNAVALGWAAIASSLLFSAVHYVGPYGDDFTAFSFAFRFLAGMVFAGLYAARSFAVAVYTHTLYDVLVLVF